MAEPKYQPGDVVTIKSDNRMRMTIAELVTTPGAEREYFAGKYVCIWWLNGEIKAEKFTEESLQLVSDNT